MIYRPFDTFCFRFPYLSYSYLEERKGFSFLQDYMNQEKWQEAIYLGSPVFFQELSKIAKDNHNSQKENRQIMYALNRYINRMATRCTPFGLFAGCGTGNTGELTTILLNEKMDRTTRLDMLFLCTLYDSLLHLPEIRQHIIWYPNTTLYPSGKQYRYVEWKYIRTRRQYELTEAERSIYLNKVLKKATKGAKRSVLVDNLINNQISREVAEEFIDELIDSQLLMGELSQSITGEDYFKRLLKLAEQLGDSIQALSPMKKMGSLLRELDNGNGGMEIYTEIIASIKELEVPYEEKYLFQVDMTNNAVSASLGKDVLEELQSAIAFLNRITPPNAKNTLSEFKDAFLNRYESREIPLMAALDPDLGLGYPVNNNRNDSSPLVDNFVLPQKQTNNTFLRHPFQAILNQKAIDCIALRQDEIVFTDEDVKDFSIQWHDLPPTIYTIIQIIRAKPDDLLLKLNFFGGSTGANLLARFAHTNQTMHNFIKEIAVKEQSLVSDAILAEIVHLPESRTGNVLCRPHIRDYEILCLTTSDLPNEQLCEMSDLLLSVRNNELIIRSKRLKKRIIPRLTTAHNYHNNSLSVYRFLCDMQLPSERGSLFFSWGAFDYPFRPRVRYRNTILSPATWSFKKKEIEYLFGITEESTLLSQISEWRVKFRLPRYMLMPDSDNELFIDWENPIDVRALFSIIKNRPDVRFNEFLFEPENAIIRDKKENPYLNECIVAFYKDKP